MWNVDPRYLCNKWLIAEHNEIHTFIGAIASGKSVQGYLDKNLLEPKSLVKRHDDLVREAKKRGFKHHSDLDSEKVNNMLKKKLTKKQLETKIDLNKSLSDLKKRCIRDLNGVEHVYNKITGDQK